jgi:DNA polymerase
MGVKSVPMKPLPAPCARGRREGGAQTADASQKAEQLRVLDESQVKECTKCTLSGTRTQTVFGQGSASARLVFVGEAPGYEEDKQGLAFVGRAGQLLTKMIVAMGLTRDEVFICNVLKCRPPGNRDPSADEVLACGPYLRRQLSIIDPEVLVALGAPAAKTLLNTAESIGRLRGRFHDYYLSGVNGEGPAVPLMPTYHPAYLLRSPAEKRKTWDDLQMVMHLLGLPVSDRKPG